MRVDCITHINMHAFDIFDVRACMQSRRSYGVYARAVNVQQASAAAAVATAKTDVAVADASRATKKQDKFWMRDPQDGLLGPREPVRRGGRRRAPQPADPPQVNSSGADQKAVRANA